MLLRGDMEMKQRSVAQKRGILVFIVLYLAYTSVYIARLNLSMASPELVKEGMINTRQIGYLGAVFSIVYAAGRLFNGTVSDRVPPFVMICSGLVLVGSANLAFSILPVFPAMMVFWAINAFAQSMLWSSVLCASVQVFGEQSAPKMTSYMVTSVAFGNIAGILLGAFLINRFGVRYAFVIPGLIPLVLAVAVFAAIRRIGKPVRQAKTEGGQTGAWRVGGLWITLAMAFMHGLIKENITVWMTVYFVDTYQIDLSKTSGFILFIPLVGLLGRLAYPPIYRLCKSNEHAVSLWGFLLCVIGAAVLISGQAGAVVALVALSLIYAAVSLVNTSLLSIYPLQFAPAGKVATVSGMMDFATYSGGGTGSFLYGLLIDGFGYGSMFFSWGMVSAVCVILAIVLKKTAVANRNA